MAHGMHEQHIHGGWVIEDEKHATLPSATACDERGVCQRKSRTVALFSHGGVKESSRRFLFRGFALVG